MYYVLCTLYTDAMNIGSELKEDFDKEGHLGAVGVDQLLPGSAIL